MKTNIRYFLYYYVVILERWQKSTCIAAKNLEVVEYFCVEKDFLDLICEFVDLEDNELQKQSLFALKNITQILSEAQSKSSPQLKKLMKLSQYNGLIYSAIDTKEVQEIFQEFKKIMYKKKI